MTMIDVVVDTVDTIESFYHTAIGEARMSLIQFVCYCSFRPMLWMGLASKATHVIHRRLFRRAKAQNDKRLAKGREMAAIWCAERAVEIGELARFLPFRFVPLDLASEFPNLIHLVSKRLAACPVKLGGPGHLNLLYSLARALKACRIVETGVAFGWSSLAFLLAFVHHDHDSILCSVDLPYLREWSTNWVGAAVPRELKSCWRLFRMADRQGLPRAVRRAYPVDLAHYDSDKSVSGRLFAYGTIWQSLRTGGVLVSDDVGDNLAFKTFAEQVDSTAIVVRWNEKFQGVLIK